MSDNVIRVVPDDLLASARVIDAHAAALQERHAIADRRIDDALPFLPGAAAAALAVKAAEWQRVTAAIVDRLDSHSSATRTASEIFADTDDDNAQRIDAVAHAVRSMIV